MSASNKDSTVPYGLTNESSQDGESHDDYGFFSWPGGKYGINLGSHESPKDIIGKSAYAFFLIPNLWSFILALIVVAFQLYLFWIMWVDSKNVTNSDFRESQSEYIMGMIGAVFMLTLRVLPDIGRGMELLSMGLGLSYRWAYRHEDRTKSFDAKLTFVGIVDLLVGASCVCVGIQYSLNKSVSVVSTITRATVAVFISGIDEHMYSFLNYWGRPGWVRWAEGQMEKNYGSKSESGSPAELIHDAQVH